MNSEQKTTLEQAALLEHYKRIIEISQELSTTYDHQALLKKIISAANELVSTEASAILLVDESTGLLRFAMSSNIKPHEMEEITVPLQGSIAGWIVTHGEPRVIEDVSTDPNHFTGVDNKISFHTRNLIGVPMRTHQSIIGVLQAVNKKNGQRFNDQDVLIMRTLASQAGLAIENARMFQQSDFMAEMVHELRTPLAALRASTTLLNRPDLPENKRSDIVSTLRRETDRLIALTNDFLNLSRLESGRTTLSVDVFSMAELINESVDIIREQALNKEISVLIDESYFEAEADMGKTKQVLLNLLTNAIKYNRHGGTINISTEAIRTLNEQPFLRVAVTDSGYGISREHQKNMFKKFYRVPTTEDVERGTGLGLTISKHIVEAHGGRIWIESEEGQGSTFFFTVPLHTNNA